MKNYTTLDEPDSSVVWAINLSEVVSELEQGNRQDFETDTQLEQCLLRILTLCLVSPSNKVKPYDFIGGRLGYKVADEIENALRDLKPYLLKTRMYFYLRINLPLRIAYITLSLKPLKCKPPTVLVNNPTEYQLTYKG